MNRGSTLFLKVTVVLIGLPVLALCIFIVPKIGDLAAYLYPDTAFLQIAIMVILYATVIPFYFALYQTFQLLRCIESNRAFTDAAVSALKNIKYCALTISVLHAVGLPILFLLAERDDAPGLILIGFVLVFASMVVAVFAAVLHKLLQEAMVIKSEHEFTV